MLLTLALTAHTQTDEVIYASDHPTHAATTGLGNKKTGVHATKWSIFTNV